MNNAESLRTIKLKVKTLLNAFNYGNINLNLKYGFGHNAPGLETKDATLLQLQTLL